MSTGIIVQNAKGTLVRLLENLAAANTLADGAAGDKLAAHPLSTQFFDFAALGDNFVWPDGATIRIYETAGSGVITVASARLLLFDSVSGKVFPPGVGTDADKGKLNIAGAFGETGADQLRHQELLTAPGHSDGVQVALGAFGGTSPTFNVDLWLPNPRRWS